MKVRCTCTSLRRAANAVTRFYDATLAPSGLLVTQFSLLRTIARLDRPTIGELATAAELDRTTLTRNLRPLLDARLVRIAPGADPRARCVELSAAGRQAIDAALPYWHAAQAKVRTALGSDDLTDLLERLERVGELAADVSVPARARVYRSTRLKRKIK